MADPPQDSDSDSSDVIPVLRVNSVAERFMTATPPPSGTPRGPAGRRERRASRRSIPNAAAVYELGKRTNSFDALRTLSSRRLRVALSKASPRVSRDLEVETERVGGKEIVKAATSEKLMGVLLQFEEGLDEGDDFAEDFILTYEYFMEPFEFLRELQEYYMRSVPTILSGADLKIFMTGYKAVRNRIIRILHTWVERDVQDFFYTEGLEQALFEFVDHAVGATNDSEMVASLLSVCSKVIEAEPHDIDPPLMQLRMMVESVKISEYDRPILKTDMEVLAQHLTMIDHAYYVNVKPTECLWLGEDKEEFLAVQSPHIHAWIRRFNTMSQWVATVLVNEGKLKSRAKLITYFLKLADRLYDLRNFNSAYAVFIGLSNDATHPNRLQATWAKVGSKTREIFERLQSKLLTPNFTVYKREVEPGPTPMVPIMAAYKKWFVMMDMVNKDEEEGLVNFQKLRLIGDLIRRFAAAQTEEYYFDINSSLLKFLLNLESHTISRDGAYQKSLEIEGWHGGS